MIIIFLIIKLTYCLLCTLVVMDGNQVLDFYWIDPIDAIIRFLAKRENLGKLYTQFVPGTSHLDPGQRVFDECSNSGMVFETAQLIDLDSSPVLALFFSDASFSGPNMSHHPFYRKSNENLNNSNSYTHFMILLYQNVFSICMNMIGVSQPPGFQWVGFLIT